MPRRRPKTDAALSLDEIHKAINSNVHENPTTTTTADSSPSTSTTPSTPIDVCLEDALQAIETAPRPTTQARILTLGTVLRAAITAAADDPHSWKLLTLTIIRKRYHARAPAAKEAFQQSRAKGVAAKDSYSNGHGERLSFYLTCVYLQILARHAYPPGTPAHQRLTQARACLSRLALPAGGTRDVCALVEHLLYDALRESGVLEIRTDRGGKRALAEAVGSFLPAGGAEVVSPELEELLTTTARLLDGDLATIDGGGEGKGGGEILPSTIHTFIPHHDRGTDARKLTQTVAELLIWSRTASANSDPAFSARLQDLHSPPTGGDTDTDDGVIANVHSLQTSVRRLRKKLNASARARGFSLCSSYTTDPSSVTLGMVRGGKDGDCAKLVLLAKKDARLMGLIAHRYADPKKAVPISSLAQLRGSWIYDDGKGCGERAAGDDDDETMRLRLDVQCATVKATIDSLRSEIPVRTEGADGGRIVVASIDDNLDSDVAAILVAAAFDPGCVWDRDAVPDAAPAPADGEGGDGRPVILRLRDETHATTTKSDVMRLLDAAFSRERSSTPTPTPDGTAEETQAATTKDVQNLIERHAPPNSQILLFASTDLKLEPRVVHKLKTERSTVHCHVDDVWSRRMEREKAKVGDITVTLAWDNRCDLDLHAICPNGDHINYNRKEGGGPNGGGYLDIDMNMSGESTEPVENIFFGDAEKDIEAAHGTYRVSVQNYGYHGKEVAPGDPVPWRVRVSKDGKNQEFTGECVGTGTKSDVVVTEFVYRGRTVKREEKVGSALEASGLVGVTSSVGSTLESIAGLMRLEGQNEVINRVRDLVIDRGEDGAAPDAEDETTPDSEDETTPDTEDETAPNASTEVQPAAVAVAASERKAFHITNRDRLYLNLSALPDSFHAQVNQSFRGGGTLMDHAASQLASRLIEDDVHVDELRTAGYPDTLVGMVKDKMVKFGV